MGFQKENSKPNSCTLFPVKKKDGSINYYMSDYSEELGNGVYKGYQCILKSITPIQLPCRINKEEIDIQLNQPIAIKIYTHKQSPSPFQFYSSEIATLKINGKMALIMDYIDGFHIYPDAQDNSKLRNLTYLQIVDIVWQLVIGLTHLHYKNTSGPAIVHGDIKGENIKIRINETIKDGVKHHKIDVLYLDIDYAKLIINQAQCPQGTPEHLALEILDGYYSETSDFFALAPLLLSLFGANNPLQKIIKFRENHTELEAADLVKKYRDIGFCTEGLFCHFEKKAEPEILKLIKQFIQSMGAKYIQDRPCPDAILEFFTALRQLSLDSNLPDANEYKLRLFIAANMEHWLKHGKYILVFRSLNENLQSRLIKLLGLKQQIQLYKIFQERNDSISSMQLLRKSIANHLNNICDNLSPPSFIESFFSSPVNNKELQWLLECYEQQKKDEFYSAEKEKIREKLLNCNEKDLTPLIAIIIDGLTSSTIRKKNLLIA